MRTLFKRFWARWKEIAAYVGDFQARLLLTLFYLIIAAPFGVIARALDPLRIRPQASRSAWLRRDDAVDTLAAAKRQF
jgi:hypothetical protein